MVLQRILARKLYFSTAAAQVGLAELWCRSKASQRPHLPPTQGLDPPSLTPAPRLRHNPPPMSTLHRQTAVNTKYFPREHHFNFNVHHLIFITFTSSLDLR